MTERPMATIAAIESLTPIEGADRIESAKVRGWSLVVQKGLYKPGDKIVYCEIDSFLPKNNPLFESFMERGTKTDQTGAVGHRVKTIRLKGVYSQGVVISLSKVLGEGYDVPTEIGADVSSVLGVQKWEPPMPAQLRGEIAGSFPGWIRKTDAERIQNFEEHLPLNPDDYYCTEKIDGTSVTYAMRDGEFFVCSRNWRLKESDTVYWKIAKKYDIEEELAFLLGPHDGYIVVQGEIYGEGINGNRLGQKGQHLAVFNFDTSIGPMPPSSIGLPSVPTLDLPAPSEVQSSLDAVDGLKSVINPDRLAEGVVWKRKDVQDIIPSVRALKAISNKYLTKEKL